MSSEIDFAGRAEEYKKQYSVWYYQWMKESLGTEDSVLERVIGSNNINWAAEHVFGVNYREYFLSLKNGKLMSPDFGDKTLLEMADDAVLIREKAGVDLKRVESEKRGIVDLEKMLGEMRIGQTAVLISPPDLGDVNMGRYNMIYIYEKQTSDFIRATAIRDNINSLDDLSVLANYLSGVGKWQDATHLDFVAKPFVTQLGFEEAVSEVGVTKKDILPDWVVEMSAGVVWAMLDELNSGRIGKVKEIFDAFQIAVKTRFERGKGRMEAVWIEPLQMVEDERLWIMAQRSFLEVGGRELMSAAGSCGIADVGLKNDGWRDNNILSSLMGIDEKKEESYSFDHEGQCVVCKLDPKRLGPCQICEDCDHKIRSQTE